MKPTLRDLGIVAVATVVVMAIVGRWPAARRVILPKRRLAGTPAGGGRRFR